MSATDKYSMIVRSLYILCIGILGLATIASASSLRAYKGPDGRIHFTDRQIMPAQHYSLFDESVLDERPLVDAPAQDVRPAENREQASLAQTSVKNYPVRTVLIEAAQPAILFDDQTELFGGESFTKTPPPKNKTRSLRKLERLFDRYGKTLGLSPKLLKAVALVESNFNTRAVSNKGAQGLMQLMPGTAKDLGVSNPFDPEQAVYGGSLYLKQQLDRFGSLDLALAAYNAGPKAVERYRGVPPYPETRNYIKRVKRAMARYQRS